MNDLDFIKGRISRWDMLAQLAEESAELAQAALKLHRKMNGTNPTPKTIEECEAALLEETADVELVLHLLGLFSNQKHRDQISLTIAEKSLRWANRLKATNEERTD